ncbi:sensor histidine kinase [Streptomyces paludis]|uniref:Sensor histidine kinase n=1 Tax=Streptomyces paludis TaxID=2282738 RepID=A0A345I1R8_9ACTN|nr:sensor histidine kinase [Streptomyces paludis]
MDSYGGGEAWGRLPPGVPSGVAGPGSGSIEERWAQFHRWAPYFLLALATVVATAAAGPMGMSGAARTAGTAALVAVLAVEVWWSRTRPAEPKGSLAGQIYFWTRTALAFLLTWLNPFYAIYATLGYWDTDLLLRRRAIRAGAFVTAVAMAGAQSGGMPPRSVLGWFVFGALLVLHCSLAVVFGHLGARESARARERAATIAELERALAENAALHAQLLVQAREAGVADERRRLAAEIHDTIAQGLTGIIAQLQVVTAASDPALARVHLERASALARHSLGEARRSVQNLSPAELAEDSLPDALRKTVAVWSERSGVRAACTVTGTEEPLHDEVAATLLRIAQEALSNTARHAVATRAGVTLSYMGDEITLDIRDDGGGFDPLALPARRGTGGFGLAGMRARAERIAGTVTVESGAGEGTAVSARVPLVRHD